MEQQKPQPQPEERHEIAQLASYVRKELEKKLMWLDKDAVNNRDRRMYIVLCGRMATFCYESINTPVESARRLLDDLLKFHSINPQ